MSPTLRALLAGLIDYAGLFPPAKLPLTEAIRHYADYRRSGERWMLGRFIIPAARLGELDTHSGLFQEQPPFVFSALGRGGKTGDEFLQGLADDLAAIAAFRYRHADLVEVDVLEVKLPDALTQPDAHDAASYTLVRAAEMIEQSGPAALTPFYEITLGVNWRTALLATLAVLQALVRFAETRIAGRFSRYRTAGFKLRCGGLEASAFPTPEQVAGVLLSCRDHGLALKATAGLHHPIRRFDPGVQAHMHGFVNVFGAAALAATGRVTEAQVRAVIEDEDAAAFTFDDTGFRWRELHAGPEEIEAARRSLALAFGSCSFDEPRADLRALGWLP